MKLKPYPKYRDSGILWIGEIPEGWGVRKINYIFINRKEKNKMLKINNILSVLKDIGVIRYEDKGNIGNKSSDNPANYKIVYPNDIVLNSMNFYIGSVGISKELGVTSSVYIILVLNPLYENLAQYFYFVFKNNLFQKYAGRLGKGIMEIREAIKYEDLKDEILPVPSLLTQTIIANFLDKRTVKINALIEKDKKLIMLLKEKRTALINHAVTKGLNPNAKFKDSGIPWIDKIPEGWEVKRLKFNALVNSSGKKVLSDPKLLVNFLPMEKVSKNGEYDTKSKTEYREVSSGYTYFENSDVLVAKITPCFENGKGALVNNLEQGFGFGTTEFHVIRSYDQLNSKYLFYLTKTHLFRVMGEAFMEGTAGQKRVPADFVKNFIMVSPPKLEQQKIVYYLDQATSKIDKTIEKIEKKIVLLEEYKKSLINNAVTGKIDVREAVA